VEQGEKVTAAQDANLVENAAAIIDGEALALRVCNTLPPDHNDWSGEEESKRMYDNWKQTVAELYALADRLRRKKP
jgi:hypothetical protein